MLHRWNDWQVSALLLAHHFSFPISEPLGRLIFSFFLNGPTLFFFSLSLSVGTDAAARSQGQCGCATISHSFPADSYGWPLHALMMMHTHTHTQSQHKVAISLSFLAIVLLPSSLSFGRTHTLLNAYIE